MKRANRDTPPTLDANTWVFYWREDGSLSLPSSSTSLKCFFTTASANLRLLDTPARARALLRLRERILWVYTATNPPYRSSISVSPLPIHLATKCASFSFTRRVHAPPYTTTTTTTTLPLSIPTPHT